MKPDSNSVILLAHDGELDDVRALLSGLGLAFVERRREPGPGDPDRPWALVVATPRRMLELDLQPESGSRRVQIAIGDTDSRTLRKTMNQRNIDFFVRRPVHPEALRLLIVHALYRGPENRRTRRVSVGAQVRFRTALRRHWAVLVDLSETGCRLMSEHAADPGLSLKVAIPAGRDTPTLLTVQGSIVQTSPARGGSPGNRVMRVTFDRLSRAQKLRLRKIVDEFATGPASSAGELEPEEQRDEDLPADLEPRREDWSQAPLPADLEREDWSEVPMPGEPDPTATAPDPSRDPAGAERDRRTESRRIFSSKVVAQANDRSRVLIARDLALGGMRTDPDPALAVGDELTIALPLVVGHVPLVIKARVIRDDADWGLVLQFRDLSEEAAAFLRQKSSFLPICDSPFEEEESAGVIVSEILRPTD